MNEIAKQAMQELGEELDEEELADAGIERPKKTVKQSSASNLKLSPEEEEWLSLLHKRPDWQDADASTKWLESLATWATPQKSHSLPSNPTDYASLESLATWATPQKSYSLPSSPTDYASLLREDVLSVCDFGEELDDPEEEFVVDFDRICPEH